MNEWQEEMMHELKERFNATVQELLQAEKKVRELQAKRVSLGRAITALTESFEAMEQETKKENIDELIEAKMDEKK